MVSTPQDSAALSRMRVQLAGGRAPKGDALSQWRRHLCRGGGGRHEGPGRGHGITIHVCWAVSGRLHASVPVRAADTVAELRRAAGETEGLGKHPTLLFEGQTLSDRVGLAEAGLHDGAVVFVVQEMFPDIQLEFSRSGIEEAKEAANKLFSDGAADESARMLSKCIWLVESGQVAGVPRRLHSVLHSNRALAYNTLERWADAEEDCSASLELNEENTKARYQRALALCNLGRLDAALRDAEQVYQELPVQALNPDAWELRQRVRGLLRGPEAFPDIRVRYDLRGIQEAKERASRLFDEGAVDESRRTLSKCIWLVQDERVVDVPDDLRSVFHSNRAVCSMKLGNWSDAEEDCSMSLAMDEWNTTARYRRAAARLELGKHEPAMLDGAMLDIEDVIGSLPGTHQSEHPEPKALRQRICEARARAACSSPSASPVQSQG